MFSCDTNLAWYSIQIQLDHVLATRVVLWFPFPVLGVDNTATTQQILLSYDQEVELKMLIFENCKLRVLYLSVTMMAIIRVNAQKYIILK